MSQESERAQRRQVGASFSWAFAGQAARRGGNFLSTIILAQILAPEEIGTFTIPFTVAMFLLSLNDLGIGYAVIRHRGDLNEVTPTAVSLAVTSSVTAWMGVIVFAPQIVDLFSSASNPAPDDAILFVRLLAVVIVFDGLTMVPGAALTRELREKDRTVAELSGFTATMATNIGVALAGGGAWALVLGQIAGVTVTAVVMIWRSPAKPSFGWDGEVAKGLVRFGLPLAGAGILNQSILNADYVIVNRYLGTEVAGAYFFAFNISNWPVTLVSLAMRRTAMASFSRLQHDLVALRRTFANAVQLLVTVTLPMAALIGVLAEEVITVLFRDEYLIGVIALRFLAAISVVRLLYQLCTDALAALGRSATILLVQALWLGTLIPAMIIGASNWELAGLGVAQFFSALCVALPILLWRLSSVGLHLGPIFVRLVRPLLGGAGLIVVALGIHELGGPAIVRLIVGGVAGLATYAAIVLPGSDVLPQVLSLVGRGPLAKAPTSEPPGPAAGAAPAPDPSAPSPAGTGTSTSATKDEARTGDDLVDPGGTDGGASGDPGAASGPDPAERDLVEPPTADDASAGDPPTFDAGADPDPMAGDDGDSDDSPDVTSNEAAHAPTDDAADTATATAEPTPDDTADAGGDETTGEPGDDPEVATVAGTSARGPGPKAALPGDDGGRVGDERAEPNGSRATRADPEGNGARRGGRPGRRGGRPSAD